MVSQSITELEESLPAISRKERFLQWASLVSRGTGGAIVLGFVLTLAQVLFAYSLIHEKSFTEAYTKLFQWDSGWYENIATQGYHSVVPPGSIIGKQDNVAFFPGFPALVSAVMAVSRLPSRTAVVLASQLACWGFWSYLLLFLRKLQVSKSSAAISIILVAVHPCSFYLVAGYSESLFLMTLLGYLYWSERDDVGSSCLAAAHGFVMTGARIIGLPVAFAPVLLALRSQKDGGLSDRLRSRLPSITRRMLVAGVASLGAGLFFAYCQWKFGCWDSYMQTQRSGWGLIPDYLAIFNRKLHRLFIPADGRDGFVDPTELSQLTVPLTMALFCVLLCREVWTRPVDGWRRAAWYFAAWWMFYVPICGLATVQMRSMIRYVLPVHVLLILAGVQLLTQRPLRGLSRDVGFALLTVIIVESVWLQATLAYHFALGHWVS
jgi:hypothetical protein